MRSRRFDKQLQSVFMVLSGLMVLVGLASFGVNRFLALNQQRVLSESIAIIERTERVAQDADFAASLGSQLAGSRSPARSRETSVALRQRVDRIAVDLQAMRVFLDHRAGPGSVDAARSLIGRMEQTVARVNAANQALEEESDALVDAATRLATLISTEADLARLRITAGVWELYALPPGADARPGLDRLADVNFFAYERLAEMAEAVGQLDRLVPRIIAARQSKDLADLDSDYQAALSLAQDRSRFLLTEAARTQAQDQLHLMEQAIRPAGLVAQRSAQIEAQAELDGLSRQLDAELSRLVTEARDGRDETRIRMQAGVASAGLLATLLSAALAIFILVALLAVYHVWGRTRTKVVLRLDDVAERMVAVARGEFGHPMPISGQDEIGRLEKALNILRRRAEEAAQLRDRLEAAVMDRTADVVAEMRSANAARADAEEQSSAKTHFLARMSHEIRTPLNGLIGLIDLLSREETDATRRARLQAALTSARDLHALTEDILAFAVREDGHDVTRSEPFDPTALAHGLGEHLRVLASDKGLSAAIGIAPDLPAALTGEPTKIRQILMNLLSNAVKYTDQGQVSLTVASRALGDGRHAISLTVSDTGPGMTAEETRQAFDIYGRSVTARRSGVRGVGLGLAIVRQLTDAMGGELRVSTAPGQGSSFTLTLSLPEADPAQVALPDALFPPGTGKRVLVVEDHPVNRLVARGYLERMGCAVTEAATGAAALDAARNGKFDILLIDRGLPDMQGEDVARQIDRKGAQVAILTADLVTDDAATRARFGVDRMLTKPIAPRALAAFLQSGTLPSPSPEPDVPPDLDAALREDIATLGAEQAAAIVTAFLDDMASSLPRLLAEPDPAARRKLAHRLKGAAANFRMTDLCALLQKVQSGEPVATDTLEQAAMAALLALRTAARRSGLPVQADGAKQ